MGFRKKTMKHGTLSPIIKKRSYQISPLFQKSYQDIARKERSSQFGVDFMKKSWNEADSNQQKGSSIAASSSDGEIL